MKPIEAPASEAEIQLSVNGRQITVTVPVRRLLSDCLREDLGLTGTHVGCEHGICGACTVLIDGEAVRSCITLAVQADGSEVTTVEGLTPRGGLSPMQSAFRQHHALQCGFCTPGFLATLASVDPQDYPDDAGVRELLGGNLCRCTGYNQIVEAVSAVWHGRPHAD
jgi:aerobic carbon-monoxide dehydrogenase small subunit